MKLPGFSGSGHEYQPFELGEDDLKRLANRSEGSDSHLLKVRPYRDGPGKEYAQEVITAFQDASVSFGWTPLGNPTSDPDERFSFELWFEDGTLDFLWSVPNEYWYDELRSVLTGEYPRIDVERQSTPFPDVNEGAYATGGKLEFQENPFIPIKGVGQGAVGGFDEEKSPLRLITTELTGHDDLTSMVQIVFTPAGSDWTTRQFGKRDAEKVIRHYREGNPVDSHIEPYVEDPTETDILIADTIAELAENPAWYTTVRYFVFGPDPDDVARHAAGIGSSYESTYRNHKLGQSLESHPLTDDEFADELNACVEREWDATYRPFTPPELAAVAHLPNDSIETPAVNWTTKGLGSQAPSEAPRKVDTIAPLDYDEYGTAADPTNEQFEADPRRSDPKKDPDVIDVDGTVEAEPTTTTPPPAHGIDPSEAPDVPPSANMGGERREYFLGAVEEYQEGVITEEEILSHPNAGRDVLELLKDELRYRAVEAGQDVDWLPQTLDPDPPATESEANETPFNFVPQQVHRKWCLDPHTREDRAYEVKVQSEVGDWYMGRDVRNELVDIHSEHPDSPIWLGYLMDNRVGFREIGFEKSEWFRHMTLFGMTGMGKSTFQTDVMNQIVRKGYGLCYIDPKGDTVKDFITQIPESRMDDVIWIEPGSLEHDKVVGLNFLETAADPSDDAYDREVSSIVDDLTSILKGGDYWGPKMEGITTNIARAMIRSEYPFTLLDMYYVLLEEESRQAFAELVADEGFTEIHKYTEQIARMDQEEVDAVVRRIQGWVEDPIARGIVAHRHGTVNITEAVENGKIILVNAEVDSQDLKEVISTAVMRRVWAAIKARDSPEHEREPFFTFIDEFDDVASEEMDMEKMLSKARSGKMGVCLACQNPSQIPKPTRDQMFANARTICSFGVGEPSDANLISQRFTDDVEAQEIMEIPQFTVFTRVSLQTDEGPRLSKPLPLNTFADYPPLRTTEEAREHIEQSLEEYGVEPLDTTLDEAEMLIYNLGSDATVHHDFLQSVWETSLRYGESAVPLSEVNERFAARQGREISEYPGGIEIDSELCTRYEVVDDSAKIVDEHKYDGDVETVPVGTELQTCHSTYHATSVSRADVGDNADVDNDQDADSVSDDEQLVFVEKSPEDDTITITNSSGGVALTNEGVREILEVEESRAAASDRHQKLLEYAFTWFTLTDFHVSIINQPFDLSVPDAETELPVDINITSPAKAQDILQELQAEYPAVYSICNGRQVVLEAEASLSKPSGTIRNLIRAQRNDQQCVFLVADGRVDDEDQLYYARRVARILDDPPLVKSFDVIESDDHHDIVERELYNTQEFLELGDNPDREKYALIERGQQCRWITHEDSVRLYAGKGDDATQRGNISVDELDSPSRNGFDHWCRYDDFEDEWIVYPDGDTANIRYDTLEAMEEDWQRVYKPVHPGHEFDTEPTPDDYEIVVCPFPEYTESIDDAVPIRYDHRKDPNGPGETVDLPGQERENNKQPHDGGDSPDDPFVETGESSTDPFVDPSGDDASSSPARSSDGGKAPTNDTVDPAVEAVSCPEAVEPLIPQQGRQDWDPTQIPNLDVANEQHTSIGKSGAAGQSQDASTTQNTSMNDIMDMQIDAQEYRDDPEAATSGYPYDRHYTPDVDFGDVDPTSREFWTGLWDDVGTVYDAPVDRTTLMRAIKDGPGLADLLTPAIKAGLKSGQVVFSDAGFFLADPNTRPKVVLGDGYEQYAQRSVWERLWQENGFDIDQEPREGILPAIAPGTEPFVGDKATAEEIEAAKSIAIRRGVLERNGGQIALSTEPQYPDEWEMVWDSTNFDIQSDPLAQTELQAIYANIHDVELQQAEHQVETALENGVLESVDGGLLPTGNRLEESTKETSATDSEPEFDLEDEIDERQTPTPVDAETSSSDPQTEDSDDTQSNGKQQTETSQSNQSDNHQEAGVTSQSDSTVATTKEDQQQAEFGADVFQDLSNRFGAVTLKESGAIVLPAENIAPSDLPQLSSEFGEIQYRDDQSVLIPADSIADASASNVNRNSSATPSNSDSKDTASPESSEKGDDMEEDSNGGQNPSSDPDTTANSSSTDSGSNAEDSEAKKSAQDAEQGIDTDSTIGSTPDSTNATHDDEGESPSDDHVASTNDLDKVIAEPSFIPTDAEPDGWQDVFNEAVEYFHDNLKTPIEENRQWNTLIDIIYSERPTCHEHDQFAPRANCQCLYETPEEYSNYPIEGVELAACENHTVPRFKCSDCRVDFVELVGIDADEFDVGHPFIEFYDPCFRHDTVDEDCDWCSVHEYRNRIPKLPETPYEYFNGPSWVRESTEGSPSGDVSPRTTATDQPAYGRAWSEEIIEDKRLGWASGDWDDWKGCIKHLLSNGYTPRQLLATGLFKIYWRGISEELEGERDALDPDEIVAGDYDLSTVDDAAKLSPRWRGRTVFPYFNEDGEPVYAISRVQKGKPHSNDTRSGAKYSKLPDEPYVYAEEPIYGVDTIEDGKPVLITEGIADAIAAHEKGIPCISPVTTQFKDDDKERLLSLLESHDIPHVYIVGDNEPPSFNPIEDRPAFDPDDAQAELEQRAEILDKLDSEPVSSERAQIKEQLRERVTESSEPGPIGKTMRIEQSGAGEEGALATAVFLDRNNIDCYVIELPRIASQKVDLDDYLTDELFDIAPPLPGLTSMVNAIKADPSPPATIQDLTNALGKAEVFHDFYRRGISQYLPQLSTADAEGESSSSDSGAMQNDPDILSVDDNDTPPYIDYSEWASHYDDWLEYKRTIIDRANDAVAQTGENAFAADSISDTSIGTFLSMGTHSIAADALSERPRAEQVPQPDQEPLQLLFDGLDMYTPTQHPRFEDYVTTSQPGAPTSPQLSDDIGSSDSDRSSSGSRSELYQLSLSDVTGLDEGFRGKSPLGHYGDSTNYFVMLSDEVGYDHKRKVTINALTYLACATGVRSSGDPSGSFDAEELLELFVKTKRETDVLSDDASAPSAAITAAAKDMGIISEAELREITDDDWGLPKDAYNQVVDEFEDVYSVKPGRGTIYDEDDFREDSLTRKESPVRFAEEYMSVPEESDDGDETKKVTTDVCKLAYQEYCRINDVEPYGSYFVQNVNEELDMETSKRRVNGDIRNCFIDITLTSEGWKLYQWATD